MLDDPLIAAALSTYVQETAPVLALRLDADGRVTDANTQARRVLRGTVVGQPLADHLVDFRHSLDLPALIRQGSAVHQLTINTVSGRPETLNFRFFPLPAGTLALASLDFQEQEKLRDQMLGLNRELNNLTRQLHQANAELQELNELKNRFLGMASHDLRKPVGVIMTYTEFVLDEAGPELAKAHRDFLRTSLTAATGMKQLIDGFLDLAVIESGQLRLERTPASAAQILAGAEPTVRLIAGKKHVALVMEPADAGRRVPVDASKLQQVLLNLAGNAIEHSVPGARVWLSSRWEGAQLVFAVRDEGPGLRPEDQARLFTAFGRDGAKKTAGERSTGLGLAIARLVVEAHGGRLWVESTPGHGATFLFSLPGAAE
ncbi:MAG: HAMP domain-containing sensor histidine kinase [Opitutae bacterium]